MPPPATSSAPPPTPNSRLYHCTIWHKRYQPRPHELLLRSFLFFLRLDELPHLSTQLRLFSFFPLLAFNAPALYSLYPSDFLGKKTQPALESTLSLGLKTLNLPAPAHIYLLAQLRFLGHVFNPIAIFFLHFPHPHPPLAIAQVTNTFGEQKLYLIPSHPSNPNLFHATHPKLFYVSPFTQLDSLFHFHFLFPDQSLSIAVNSLSPSDHSPILRATLKGKARPLTPSELLRQTLLCPFASAKSLLLIHWHALLLFLKKIPYSKKQDNPHLQTLILNPLPHLPQSSTKPPEILPLAQPLQPPTPLPPHNPHPTLPQNHPPYPNPAR